METHACVMRDTEDPLCRTVVQRGVLSGLVFYLDEDALNDVSFFGAERRAFPNAFQPIQAAPDDAIWLETSIDEELDVESSRRLLLSYDESHQPVTVNGATRVVIHDMLPPQPSHPISNLFTQWGTTSALEQPMPLHHERGGYWCNITDVANAVVAMVKCIDKLPPLMHVSGRRYWSLEATKKEFDNLYDRSVAGQQGRFEPRHLTAAASPEIQVVSLDAPPLQPERPDLSILNTFLQECQGEGWRPSVPLRQSLMLVIAELKTGHSSV